MKNSQMYGNPSQVATISTLELSDLPEISGWAQSQDHLRRFVVGGQVGVMQLLVLLFM
jgi:hypothetical protein